MGERAAIAMGAFFSKMMVGAEAGSNRGSTSGIDRTTGEMCMPQFQGLHARNKSFPIELLMHNKIYAPRLDTPKRLGPRK